MKFETYNKIYCNDLNQLKSNLTIFEESKYGSTSTIYTYKNLLLKIFKEGFINETIENNKNYILTHTYIKHLNIKNIIKMKKALIYNKYFYGYTMKKFPGNRFIEIPEDTTFDCLKESLKQIDKDIKILSQNKIVTADINTSNLLYDSITNTSFIIDTDCYYIDNKSSQDCIMLDNIIELSQTVYDGILGDKKLYDKKTIYNIRNVLYKKLETIKGIEDSIDILINIVEELSDSKIDNIKTFRKVLNNKI